MKELKKILLKNGYSKKQISEEIATLSRRCNNKAEINAYISSMVFAFKTIASRNAEVEWYDNVLR